MELIKIMKESFYRLVPHSTKIREMKRKDFDELVFLEIPRKKRREYLEAIYSCRIINFYRRPFYEKLDELKNKKITSEKAVLEFEEMFKHLNEIYAEIV